MNEFFFDIIRRSRNSYEWVFVAFRDGRPRVLARSGRDYRSRKKTRRAIERLQYAFPRAEIRSRDPYPLPYTRFDLVPGVLPLRAGTVPSGFEPSSPNREREFAALTPANGAEEENRTQRPEPEKQEDTTAAPAEQEQKAVTAGRRRKAT